MDTWLRDHLVCPRDHGELRVESESGQHESGKHGPSKLACANGHQYPVIQGIPVMLLDDVQQTLRVADDTLRKVWCDDDPYFVDTVNCVPEERAEIRKLIATTRPGDVDPIVQFVLGATNGILYRHLRGKLREYPIPELRWPRAPAPNATLLDVGCNWGRWSVAAARKGYRVTGLDPSLGAVMAAKRVSAQLGLPIQLVAGDARFMPFAPSSFSRVFSYSVLQHFSKEDAQAALSEVARVLEPGGESLIQMANAFGLRSLQHQLRRAFREPRAFEVRYWSPRELRRVFSEVIGETCLSVDGYFGLGIQATDVKVMPAKFRAVIRASEILRRLSATLPIAWAADSLYLHSRRGHFL